MDLIEKRDVSIYDMANTIRYLLSYSKNEEQFFENLIKRGILLISENNSFKFKTPFYTLSDKEIAESINDDFFLTENMKKHMGYNLRNSKEN